MAPDVCDIVEYGLDSFRQQPATYRVDAWLKPYVEPFRVTGYDMLLTGAFRAELDGPQRAEALLYSVLGSLKEKAPKRTRLVWCCRDEATHVALSGVGGAVAPITECKVVSRVAWSDEVIQQSVDYANLLAKEGGLTDCYL